MRMRGHDYPFKRQLRPLVRALRYVGLTEHDGLIAAYPKSGSTWLRFMLTELLTGIDPEWRRVNATIPYVGGHRRAPRVLEHGGRLLLSHDRAAGPCRRIVYLARDVRDVVMSEYRWVVRGGAQTPFPQFLDAFASGRTDLFGSWGAHVRYWLDSEQARRGDLYVVRYEDLRLDPILGLRGVLEHLGLRRSDEQIIRAVEDNSLERMRAKEGRASPSDVKSHATGEPFVGRGGVGSWRSTLGPDALELLDRLAREDLVRLGYGA
jgi:hypothetical protein